MIYSLPTHPHPKSQLTRSKRLMERNWMEHNASISGRFINDIALCKTYFFAKTRILLKLGRQKTQ